MEASHIWYPSYYMTVWALGNLRESITQLKCLELQINTKSYFPRHRSPLEITLTFICLKNTKTKYKQIIVPLFSSPSHDISLDSRLNCCHTLSKPEFTVLLCLCKQLNKLSGSHLNMVSHVWLWFEKCSLKGPWSRGLGFSQIPAQKLAYSANRKELETHSVEQPCLYD